MITKKNIIISLRKLVRKCPNEIFNFKVGTQIILWLDYVQTQTTLRRLFLKEDKLMMESLANKELLVEEVNSDFETDELARILQIAERQYKERYI